MTSFRYSFLCLILAMFLPVATALPRWVPAVLSSALLGHYDHHPPGVAATATTQPEPFVSTDLWKKASTLLFVAPQDRGDAEHGIVYLYALLGLWLVVESARTKWQDYKLGLPKNVLVPAAKCQW